MLNNSPHKRKKAQTKETTTATYINIFFLNNIIQDIHIEKREEPF